jgi:pyruvate-ferredoxin/flavodoxin oxidoreductase
MARTVTFDGNEAAASVAHRLSEVIAIYPITPSSAMGELADEWSAHGKSNLWGVVPTVVEMQSEGGAAGAVHGALQGGALATTFTASQGLLLMIPNMYKIAGELTSFCMHVAARAIATHALSIFGDHSDVMACRQTGFALLSSASVQEAHDLACVAHAATLAARLPFLHFFDGFRTSHELAKISYLEDDDLRAMIDEKLVEAHRARGLTPDHPVLRGTAQNPDVFFQAREAVNGFYAACPEIVQRAMDRFAALTGRSYRLFDYTGAADAERVIVVMGSACETVHHLRARGEKVGVLQVRLYRPFAADAFLAALPPTVRGIAVLDRTKEPGALGEPLYLDVVTALRERGGGDLADALVIGGRYGLASKELTPAMVEAMFAELSAAQPRRHFSLGITDDVTHESLAFDAELDIEPDDVVRAVFFGLGSDGTVSANKSAVKIIAEETDLNAQGYFVYDSKKSGAVTVSHLRFGPRPIHSTYLVKRASFVACHQFSFLERQDVLEVAAPGATFLLNAPYGPDDVWSHLPREVQQQIVEKKLQLHVVDAHQLARTLGMNGRINTIMQTCFFALSGVLPREEAIGKIKDSIRKAYARKGPSVVDANVAAVDATLAELQRVAVPSGAPNGRERPQTVALEAPPFVQRVTAVMLEGKGDLLPVSAFPVDGTWPLGTAKWEKRNIAQDIPVWDEALCIQCNKCAFVCPHAAIRAKVYPADAFADAPQAFKGVPFKGHEYEGQHYTIQVAPEDCTGCSLCAVVCPAKDKSNPRHKALDMKPQAPLRETERENFQFFLDLPEVDRATVRGDIKSVQLLEPLFEFSGACSGCGETPYVKLLTQMFGDRSVIANATGCSSIYGGDLPTTPYTTNADGRGPAWSDSLFEDNAEFGLGARLALDFHRTEAEALLRTLAGELGDELVKGLLEGEQQTEAGVRAQRERVTALQAALAKLDAPAAKRLRFLADALVRKGVWIVGGDGWAYDIGFGGLDHVLSLGRDVNVLVLDTEVYSNTSGQQSKATPLGASAKFAIAGKGVGKKDIGLMAMSYGNVYVAHVAFGAKDQYTVRAFQEAAAHPGPSLIIAYSHCIAHGYDLAFGLEQQKRAVATGYWPLYRWDPRRIESGESPLQLDSTAVPEGLIDFMRHETRFRVIEQENPKRFHELATLAKSELERRVRVYQELAHLHLTAKTGGVAPAAASRG